MKGGGKGRLAEEAEANPSPGLRSSSSVSFPSVKKMRRRRPMNGPPAEEAEAKRSPGLRSFSSADSPLTFTGLLRLIFFTEDNEAEETGEGGG